MLRVVVKNEFLNYFRSSIAYIFAVVFLLVVNGIYMNTFFLVRTCDMRGFFEPFPVILLVFTAALTMRLWAEERKTGTIELLYSFPFPSSRIVLGKFLATLAYATLVTSGTLIIPVMLASLGDPDSGHILGGYLGSFLLLSYFVSLGLFVSALFQDQITAFILTLVTGLFSVLVGTNLVSASVDGWIPGLGSFLRTSVGVLPHFSNFVKGTVPLRDVLFFVSYSAAFLLLNYYTVEGFLRYYHRKLYVPSVVLVLGVVVILNGVLSQLRLPKLDLTEGKIYTVSPAAKEILESLKAPVKVVYYVSSPEKLPAPMKTLARDVRDLLDEFASLSPMFNYAVVDPERDPEMLKALAEKGVEPFAVQTIEKDQLSIKKVYSSIVISYLDKPEEVIPQVVPETLSSLEYEIVSRIYKLSLDKKPLVAMFSGGDAFSGEEFEVAREIVKELGFKVKNTSISKNDPIPEETKLLVVLSPGKLNRRQLFEIGEFLYRGGSVLVAAQANRFSYLPGPKGDIVATPISQDLSINLLLENYGLRIPKDILFDLQSVPMAVSQERRIGIFRTLVRIPVNFPTQIQLLKENMSEEVAFTKGVNSLLYLWGSPVFLKEEKLKESGLTVKEFLWSSSHAWLKSFEPSGFSQEEVEVPKEGFKRFVLGVLVEGEFPRMFSGVPPSWPEDEGNSTENATEKGTEAPAGKGRFVVVGCSEMFTDRIIGVMDNSLFWANLVESLALGGKLVSFRAKLAPTRFIGEVSEAQKVFWKVVVVGAPAVFWIALGLFVSYKRKKRRREGFK